MEYYVVKEKLNIIKAKKCPGNVIFLEVINKNLDDSNREDENLYYCNLINRNKYLDLYNSRPLVENEENVCYAVEIPKTTIIKSDDIKRMNWHDYQQMIVINSWMDDLENKFPSICTVFSIGKTVEGRAMRVLKVSNSETGNSPVWIDAGIHAREWIAPAVNTFIADYIVRNFAHLPQSFTNKDWYFLPVANPDGYEYTHNHERMWRKNRAWYGGECHGVDLNRNFSFAWGGVNSSNDPASQFFRGRAPFSEPESSAMRVKYQDILTILDDFDPLRIPDNRFVQKCNLDALKNIGIKFKVYVTLHSYGQVITFPFGYRDELSPDYIRLLQGATAMSKAIYASTGNTYKVGISKDVMYGASGTSTDWSYGAANIPFCYLIELRSNKHKFNLPREEIQETCNEILNFSDTLFSCFWYEKLFKVAPPCGKTQVWEVKLSSEKQRCFIKSLDTVGAVNIWKEERSSMDIMVEGPKTTQVADLLRERCIPYCIAIGDVGRILERDATCKTKFQKLPRGMGKHVCMDWNNYHRLNVIYEFMDRLAEQWPSLCSVCTIGCSAEGRNIRMLKVSNGNCKNVPVWLDAAIHPREWISTAVVTYVADQIVRTFHQQPEFIQNKDWYILPVVNPDGYEYTHTHDRMWRKNRARYGECCGVDLNRNFSCGWGERGEEGSSEDPGNIFYRGPEPFSEPETNAIRQVICASTKKFRVYLSFHSYGEVIIFPWGYTSDPCPDYVQMLEAGTAMAKAIQATSGHTYKVGSTKDLMYCASGTATDWSYAVANIPYSYMVELRGKRHRFLLPKEEIICTALEVFCGVRKMMEHVDRRCKVPCRLNAQLCPRPNPVPRNQYRLTRSHSCQSSRSACSSRSPSCGSARSHSCRSSRSHSNPSSQSQFCDSSQSYCPPSKVCPATSYK